VPGRWKLAILALAAAIAPAAVLAGCESTQDKSARLAQEGKARSAGQKGVVVTRQSSRVEVVSTAVVQDDNGAAAVVTMRNATRRPLAALPVSIDVRGRNGHSVFKNDDPGLEPSLVTATVLRPGERLTWVNDQLAVTEPARAVRAKVGDPRARSPNRVPRISVGTPKLVQDPVSGTSAEGFVTNRSAVEQRKLVVTAVGRRGGKVVAAGRAQIRRVQPGKRARYTIFFIGNPRGAKLELTAPPTRLD
jgi:hypothetical protein